MRKDFLWQLVKPLAVFGNNPFNARRQFQESRNDTFDYKAFFTTLKVLNSPFKGMMYPRFDSVGSAICPKLIGSYEKELHPVIEKLKGRTYTEILDIGCAEGYYAVGLGLLFNDARIYAYDLDPKARLLCRQMAEINGLQDRFEIRSECTTEGFIF